jgi:arylsulfatase A-like enzyme
MPRALVSILAALALAAPLRADARPNILVILTDDQGYGDLGCHGNPLIRTPNLDRLAGQAVRLTNFYVCPVCSPTRSSLLTGRYNYRTGIVDTFLGRSLMRPDEVTLARMLADAGYRTALFGKWHLGDNYPLRPQDRGFDEVLMHRGGGIGQPSDPPGGGHYQDPFLEHNGRPLQAKGYCSDVFTDAALAWMAKPSEKPFLVWLAFNCPHTPLQVPDRYLQPYRQKDLAHDQFPRLGQPLPGVADQDMIARVYGMITNIDDNVGRLLAFLDEKKLADNTIVVFLSDNGPQQVRWNGGLRDRKGSVHEGGIRVPCFLRWPHMLRPGVFAEAAAHIDLTPTLLEACRVPKPERVQFDGRSLLGSFAGDGRKDAERTLYFQWHRGDVPERNRACAARGPRWKLVQPLGANGGPLPNPIPFQLFDLAADPFEMKDVAAQHPEVVAQMRAGYEDWFADVCRRGFDPVRPHLGTEHENPVRLTRQDWRGPKANWGADGLGFWEVQVARKGSYRLTVRFPPLKEGGKVRLSLAGVRREVDLKAGAAEHTFDGLELPEGPARLEASVERDGKEVGVHYADVERVEK